MVDRYAKDFVLHFECMARLHSGRLYSLSACLLDFQVFVVLAFQLSTVVYNRFLWVTNHARFHRRSVCMYF